MSAPTIDVPVQHPGDKPKRPSTPRKPKLVSLVTEEVWSSENSDCSLSEILGMIPPEVAADSIHINVERNPNGYLYTRISYNIEMPNTRYSEQLVEYEKRMMKNARDLKKWERMCAEWEQRLVQHYESVKKMQEYIIHEFEQHVA